MPDKSKNNTVLGGASRPWGLEDRRLYRTLVCCRRRIIDVEAKKRNWEGKFNMPSQQSSESSAESPQLNAEKIEEEKWCWEYRLVFAAGKLSQRTAFNSYCLHFTFNSFSLDDSYNSWKFKASTRLKSRAEAQVSKALLRSHYTGSFMENYYYTPIFCTNPSSLYLSCMTCRRQIRPLCALKRLQRPKRLHFATFIAEIHLEFI